LSFALDWVPFGKHVPFFASLDKGFFKEEGLDVEILRGNGSGETVKVVNTKKVHYGLADMGTMIIARAAGGTSKMVSMFHHKNMFVIYVLKDSGIRTPKDLEGKTLGALRGSATYSTFAAFAGLAGIDVDKVKFEFMDAPSVLPSVLTGKIHGGLFFQSDLPTHIAKARGGAQPLGTLRYRDSGFNVYSNGIIAHDDDLMGKPDRVRRFLKATTQGLAFGVDQPEEAARAFVKHNPTASPEVSLEQWKVAIDLMATEEAKKNGIGFILADKMKATRDLMVRLMNIKTEIQVEDLYTNDFNPKIFPRAW
jgi:NitT/TauT family transport system substrate-binding protein